MKLFLDDERQPHFIYGGYENPDGLAKGWQVVRTVKEAKEFIKTGKVKVISLDHDLGKGEPTGYDLCKWMTKNKLWPETVYFHSYNPIGVKNMKAEHDFYLRHKDKI